MKVYGFDSTDILRGELRAAEADATDRHYGMEIFAGNRDWEFASTQFRKAQQRLIAHMQAEGVAQDMIDAVKTLKPSYISVE